MECSICYEKKELGDGLTCPNCNDKQFTCDVCYGKMVSKKCPICRHPLNKSLPKLVPDKDHRVVIERIGNVETQWIENIEGCKDGPYIKYHNGILIKSCYYKDNELHGEFKMWWGNGQLCACIHYKDGMRHGETKTWHDNKELYELTHYKNGKKDGEWKGWHSNGQLWYLSHYKNGKLHGKYMSWHDNGNLCEISNYNNGKLHGEYKQFLINEELSEHSHYINGNKII